MDKPVSTVNTLFQEKTKLKLTGSSPDLISSLAKLLDVSDEYLLYDNISSCRNNFNNLLRVEDEVKNEDLISVFNPDPKPIKYFKISKEGLFFKSMTVAKLRNWGPYLSLEIYNVDDL